MALSLLWTHSVLLHTTLQPLSLPTNTRTLNSTSVLVDEQPYLQHLAGNELPTGTAHNAK